MGSFNEWKKARIDEDLGNSRTPPNLPRVIDGKVGNELTTDAGRTARDSASEGEPRFRNSVDQFKTRITENPVPRSQDSISKKGFGNLGSDVFKREVEKAGQNPTLSNGIPVGKLKGQFEHISETNAFQQHAGQMASQGMEDSHSITQRIMTLLQGKPVTVLSQVWNELGNVVPNMISSQNVSQGRKVAYGTRNQGKQMAQSFGRVPQQN